MEDHLMKVMIKILINPFQNNLWNLFNPEQGQDAWLFLELLYQELEYIPSGKGIMKLINGINNKKNCMIKLFNKEKMKYDLVNRIFFYLKYI